MGPRSAPVVAVPAYHLEPGRVSRWLDSAAVALPMQYVAAIGRAGGRTVLIAGADGTDPAEILEPFDALLLAGGGDVDPARYGQERHETIYGVDAERDDRVAEGGGRLLLASRDVGREHLRPFAHEHLRRRACHAGSGSGDDRDLAVELSHDVLLCCRLTNR